MRARAACVLLVLCMALSLCACETRAQKFSETRYGLFDTVCTLTLYAKNRAEFDALCAPVWETLSAYDRALDIYHAREGQNNLYAVNQNASLAPTRADPLLLEALLWLKTAQTEVRGRVNAAMGAALALWHAAREAGGPPPDMDALQNALAHANFDDVLINEAEGTVFFRDPLLKLDLGAVGKGLAARAALEKLRALGVTSGVMDLGGAVTCIGAPMDGRESWRVAVESPFQSGDAAAFVRANDISLVTSGDYQRYFTYEGARYHHILQPETGMPGGDFASVTILCADPARADLYSTAVFLMPYEEGRAFVDALSDAQAYWIFSGGETRYTDGLEALLEGEGA